MKIQGDKYKRRQKDIYNIRNGHKTKDFQYFKCNYSGTLNKSTNTDFGHRDMSDNGFIAKLKMTSVGINLQN